MLQDQYGRRFEYLRLSITDVCNFRCNYCLPDGYHCEQKEDFLSLAEITTLVSSFAQLGMKKIRLTGGEPALRKDLPEIVSICKQTPGIEKVALTTNGFKLQRQAKELADAGLDAVNVSMDSLDPRLFHSITGHNKLDKVLGGVEQALAEGISSVKLNAVLLKSFNLEQFPQYLNWIKHQPLTMRFIELMETGDNKQFFQQNHVKGQDIKNRLLDSGWTQVIRNKLSGPAEEFYHPDYDGKIGLIMPYSKDFCNQCNRLRMSSIGKLHLCLFADAGIDIRPALTASDVDWTSELLQKAMGHKVAAHQLQENQTGSTTHLAMLGG